MASKAASKRLAKEFASMQRDPPPFVWAAPDEKDILTWYYIVRGPPDSPFAGGEYLGVILFPSDFPFKPPGIKMLTPSGRFQPDRKICFSMSDFHPGSWNPAWTVATILTALLSFMLSDEMTTGGVTTTDADKRNYAARSHAWNLQNKRFKDMFPEYCTEQLKDLPNMGLKELGKSDVPAPAPTPAPPTIARHAVAPTMNAVRPASTTVAANVPTPPVPAPENWFQSVAKLLSDKWRWGAFLVLAVIVSRLTG